MVPAVTDDADTWGLDAGMAPEVEFRRTGRGVAPADMSHSVKTGWLVVGSVKTIVKLGKLLEADLECRRCCKCKGRGSKAKSLRRRANVPNILRFFFL